MVLEDESAFTRGRIPAHELKITLETSIVLLQAKANQSRNRARMFEMELNCESDVSFNNHLFTWQLGHTCQ
jgi:hypothetical protein